MSALPTPSNAYIIPVDVRSTSKTVLLPDVASNPGRFLVLKDMYGNANVSSIFISTLSNNFFEQSTSNLFIGNQKFGAWTLTNDGISRWIFTNIYSNNAYIYKQTSIVTAGLVYSYEGYNYTRGNWPDNQGPYNMSSPGAAAPFVSVDNENQNILRFNGTNNFTVSYTPITVPELISTSTYSLWFKGSGTILTETANPSTFISSQARSICGTYGTTLRTGYVAQTGQNVFCGTIYDSSVWNNLQWTLGISTSRQYLNGFSTQTSTNNPLFRKSTVTTFYPVIGMGNPAISFNAYFSNPQFNGLIGSLRLYSTVLTHAEIIQNYNAEAYRYGLNQLPGF